MPENEVIYRTNLDLDKTLARLPDIPGLKILYDKQAPPVGIAQLYWKNVSCRIGAKGGVQIHYDNEAELLLFLCLLKSNASYREGEFPQWVKTKYRCGRTYCLNLNKVLMKLLEEELCNPMGVLLCIPEMDKKISPSDRASFLQKKLTRFIYYTALLEHLKWKEEEGSRGSLIPMKLGRKPPSKTTSSNLPSTQQ